MQNGKQKMREALCKDLEIWQQLMLQLERDLWLSSLYYSCETLLLQPFVRILSRLLVSLRIECFFLMRTSELLRKRTVTGPNTIHGPLRTNSSYESFTLPNGNTIVLTGIGAKIAESMLKGEPFDKTGIKKGTFKAAFKRLSVFMRQAGYEPYKSNDGIVRFEPIQKSKSTKNIPNDVVLDEAEQRTKDLKTTQAPNVETIKLSTIINPVILDNDALTRLLLMGELNLGGRIIIMGTNKRCSKVYFEQYS